MSDLPPFLYRTYRQNLHRTTTKTRKERELHKLERIMYFWPMWWYIRFKGRRLKPEQTIKTPEGVFFNVQDQGDSWLLT